MNWELFRHILIYSSPVFAIWFLIWWDDRDYRKTKAEIKRIFGKNVTVLKASREWYDNLARIRRLEGRQYLERFERHLLRKKKDGRNRKDKDSRKP